MRKIPQPVLICAALILFPFVILAAWRNPTLMFELLSRLPLGVLGVAAFLGAKLGQRRIWFAASAFALSFTLLRFPTVWLVVHPLSARASAVSFALPVSLFFLFLFQENWLRKRPVAVLASAVVIVPLVVFAWGVFAQWSWLQVLLSWNFRFLFWRSALSFTAVFLALALLNPYTWPNDLFAKDFRIFATVALLPVFFAIEAMGSALVLTEELSVKLVLAWLSASSILVYASFRLYWLQVYRDELTGILNRRALNDKLLNLRKGYTIAMADIDHFKRFNDSFGHEQGDTVLKLVAAHLANVEGASVFRYGGEEICLVFENCAAEKAAQKMESLRESLALRNFHLRAPDRLRALTTFRDREKLPKAPPINITFSVGIASPQNEKEKPEEVLVAADGALYKAKALGRNRVVIAGSDFHHTQKVAATGTP